MGGQRGRAQPPRPGAAAGPAGEAGRRRLVGAGLQAGLASRCGSGLARPAAALCRGRAGGGGRAAALRLRHGPRRTDRARLIPPGNRLLRKTSTEAEESHIRFLRFSGLARRDAAFSRLATASQVVQSRHHRLPSRMVATARPLSSRLGRYELRQPLGKSSLTMTWLAVEAGSGHEVLICMPRAPLTGVAAQIWRQGVQTALRLKHPRIAAAIQVDEQEHWPYIVYERQGLVTLSERLASGAGPTPQECVQWTMDLLDGLAYAHEGGAAHLDIGLHTVVLDNTGKASLLGMAVAAWPPPAAPGAGGKAAGGAIDTEWLNARREAGDRDLLMAGLVLHRLLAAHPALDDPDIASAAERVGREIVRLPWTLPHPVAEPLRAIVNRATDRQPRQRYIGARSLLRALHNWLETSSQESGGPLVLLLDRLNSVGHLPGRPGLARRVARLARMEGQRLDEMVELIVQDPALVCELLRQINAAHFIGHGDGPVSSVRRAVHLMGMQGVQAATQGLRNWPGAIAEGVDGPAAQALANELKTACVAGVAAEILCPPGTDAQEALIAGMFQHLGRLLVLYHFPDEAAQVHRLTLPAPPAEPGGQETPGMIEEAAAYAVLGVDFDSLGLAVARHWGLDEALIHAMRPLSLTSIVRRPDARPDILRASASLANEAIAASRLPAQKQGHAFQLVVQRYGRVLDVDLREIQLALSQARRTVDEGSMDEAARPAAAPVPEAAAGSGE
ncbi:MAG: HDOD domain-containing protein [Aquabacterium sp.]|nr:MAG: HDOD domain-containing protein [Aquabacterium sp.]